jgi:hypothetical protein
MQCEITADMTFVRAECSLHLIGPLKETFANPKPRRDWPKT